MIWEYFLDKSYYGMWAVRPVGDYSFNSPRLYHIDTEEEAKKLCELLGKSNCAEEIKPNV